MSSIFLSLFSYLIFKSAIKYSNVLVYNKSLKVPLEILFCISYLYHKYLFNILVLPLNTFNNLGLQGIQGVLGGLRLQLEVSVDDVLGKFQVLEVVPIVEGSLPLAILGEHALVGEDPATSFVTIWLSEMTVIFRSCTILGVVFCATFVEEYLLVFEVMR